MQYLNNLVIYLIIGIGLLTTLEVTISILSRKIKLHYGYFSLLSLVIYFAITYFLYKETSFNTAMILVMILGFYDGKVGLIVSNKLNADYGEYKAFLDKLTPAQIASATILTAIICGLLAILTASLL